MTGIDKFNKYYLVTAAEYERKQIKPPPFTQKGIQNARIARAYGSVRDAQDNVPSKTIYQAMTELGRELEQVTPRQQLYQDRPRRSPERRQEREQREQSRSISPVRQRRPVRHEARRRGQDIHITPIHHQELDFEPVATPQTEFDTPPPIEFRDPARTHRRRPRSLSPEHKSDNEIMTMFNHDDVIRPPSYYRKRKTTPLSTRDTHRVGPPKDAVKSKKKPPTRFRTRELNNLLDSRQTVGSRLRAEKIAAESEKRARAEEARQGRGRGRGQNQRGSGAEGTGEWIPY